MSAKYEDIALEIIKSIYVSKDRSGTLATTISAFASSNKKLADKLTIIKQDMDAGDETLAAFYNNGFIREQTYSLLNALHQKSSLGAVVIDAMIQSNRQDTAISKKARSLLVQPVLTFAMGIMIGNYLLNTGVSIIKENQDFNVQINDLYYLVYDNMYIATALELLIFIPFVLMIVQFFILKTGGVYRYLYKANILIYFLRKSKTPFKEIFEKVKQLLPRTTKAYKVVDNMKDEIESGKQSHEFLKDYLTLYPFQVLTTKMPQITRGNDTDVFLDLSEDSLNLYNDFTTKINSMLPTVFLVMTLGYVVITLLPLFAFIGTAMDQSQG